MRHHTKDKGDSGLGHIISDLLDHNIQVALPISEHLPFDLIAISEDNRLRKISVKFRRAVKEAIRVQGRSSWSDKKGVHVVVHEKGLYDALALYCPDTCKCYYVKSSEFSESYL